MLGHKAGEVSDDKMLAKLQEEYEEKFDMTWVGLYGQKQYVCRCRKRRYGKEIQS